MFTKHTSSSDSAHQARIMWTVAAKRGDTTACGAVTSVDLTVPSRAANQRNHFLETWRWCAANKQSNAYRLRSMQGKVLAMTIPRLGLVRLTIPATSGVGQACTTKKARRAKPTNINLPRAAKSIPFCCSLTEILERQLITSEFGLLQHFLQLRALTGACGPYVMHAWCRSWGCRGETATPKVFICRKFGKKSQKIGHGNFDIF